MVKSLSGRIVACFVLVFLFCGMFIGLPVFATGSADNVQIQIDVPGGFREHIIVYFEQVDNFEVNFAARVTASRDYVTSTILPAGKYNVTAFLENGNANYSTTLVEGSSVVQIPEGGVSEPVALKFETVFVGASSEGATLPPDAETVSTTQTEKGYLFLQADVPPGFIDTIAVTLTDVYSGKTEEFKLYAINEYIGNFKASVGTYFVSAEAISSNEDLSYYIADCDPGEIDITNAQLAVGVVIDVGYDPSIDEDTTKEDVQEVPATKSPEDVRSDPSWIIGDNNWSFIGSVAFSLLLVAAGWFVMVYLKKR